ncbi:MAG: hypothetical protein WAN43_05535 [Rhodomicrobium sp.]
MKLSIQELATAKNFLRRAHTLIAGVSSAFFYAGDSCTSARLNDISSRVADEIRHLDKLMTTTSENKP